MAGALVLVATPIGNLGDLSARAVETLAAADVVACEDTRHTRKLLTHAGIKPKQLVSVHEHNESSQAAGLVDRMARGERVALVTDAGTPAISDPGHRLTAAAIAAGIPVEVVPGPSALVAGLVVSGLPTDRFVFEGFLPRKGRARSDQLAALAAEARTIVLYEAPHRLAATVADLAQSFGGNRRVALCRELTKRFEEVWRGTLSEAAGHVATAEARGEYVVVVEGAPDQAPPTEADIEAALTGRLEGGMTKRAAVDEVAAELRLARRVVYEVALRLPPSAR